MKATAQMGGLTRNSEFEKWWDALPDSLPHHTKDQMRLAWDAACGSIESVRSDKEIGEFQQQVYELCKKFYPEVDGSGTDSGDWCDFTLAEIEQTLNHLAESVRSEARRAALEEAAKVCEGLEQPGERELCKGRYTDEQHDHWACTCGASWWNKCPLRATPPPECP